LFFFVFLIGRNGQGGGKTEKEKEKERRRESRKKRESFVFFVFVFVTISSARYPAISNSSFRGPLTRGRRLGYVPLLGQYDSGDAHVINAHIDTLRSAGVDYLILDLTNNIGVCAATRATALMS
jgi:C-terminal processing protease CtpA/Prc